MPVILRTVLLLTLMFVLVLIGTTIQVLTERSREQFHVARWRNRVKDHVVVCGYGTIAGTRHTHNPRLIDVSLIIEKPAVAVAQEAPREPFGLLVVGRSVTGVLLWSRRRKSRSPKVRPASGGGKPANAPISFTKKVLT